MDLPQLSCRLGGIRGLDSCCRERVSYTDGIGLQRCSLGGIPPICVDFLKEAKHRLGNGYGGVFDNAIGPYEIVTGHLKEVTSLYPFGDLSEAHIGASETSHTAAEALKRASEAEAAGLGH